MDRLVSPRVLLVEDDPAHAALMREALSGLKCGAKVVLAHDGRQALEFLLGSSQTSSSQFHLAVIDLDLPHVDGFEVLKLLKSDPAMRRIPVVVFTASCQETDFERANRLGANSYVVKPRDPGELSRVMEALCDYWLQINVNPAL